MEHYHHHPGCCGRKATFLLATTFFVLMISIAATNLDGTEAVSAADKQTNEKQPTSKHQRSQNPPPRARSSAAQLQSASASKQNRSSGSSSSSSSLVRLSKAQHFGQFSDPIRDILANYRNEPPLFITATRDFVVDVAKSYPGKRVTVIQANDGDGDPLKFHLRQAPIRDASAYFTINSTTGELRLSAKQFKYRLKEESSNSSLHNHENNRAKDQDNDDDDEDEDEQQSGENSDETPKVTVKSTTTTGRDRANEQLLNLYFLNVAVSDGQATHDSTVELNIHVTNSTLMKLRELQGVSSLAGEQGDDAELEVQHLQQLMRDKSREFYAKLAQVQAPSHQQRLSSSGNSSTLVYPDFVNPGLSVVETKSDDSTTTDLPLSESSTSSAELQPDQTAVSGQTTPASSLSSPAPPPVGLTQVIGPAKEHQSQPALPAPASDPMMMNLIMVMCSCLMIALVLLMFIVPLSVKKLRKRLKHVELQHEHLSQKTSNVSSTIGSSLTGTTAHHHHPSLSQFTLGSEGSNFCTRRDSSSSVFRQSSLDSAMTSAPLSPSAHQQFNRVDNGSIANPVYLHQHRQHHDRPSPAVMYDPFKQPPDMTMLRMQQQQQQVCGLRAPNVAANENIYYPLSDEFYSTIQTDTAPLGDDGNNQFGQQVARASVSNYMMAQCAQPDLVASEDGRLGSPDSNGSSPALRSLARFLSLPDRRQSSEEQGQAAAERSSTVKQLEMQLGSGIFSTLGPASNQVQQQQFNARTIARTCNVDREQQIRGGWELERHRLRIPWVLLDEGQFGQVWRCKLSQGPRQPERLVAVKSLKKNAANGERGREELLAEIEIMKPVCDHPNVVKLLHCCTLDDTKPILLVMEYIEQGKLQSYLEKSRINHHYGTSPSSALVATAAPDVDGDMSPHHQMPPSTINTIVSDYLTSRDLMKFIYHVAKGMEYISSKCIVHRDLASRNILVSGQKICKIGDFGMARHMQSFADVYERHSGNCKIPVRWMAPEVLLSNSFTIKSDVFSFGILMWEIITLGSTPYTHLKTEQVIDRVARNGERPERPEYCHPQLYNIMSQCWQPEPAARPTFKNLVDTLGELVLSANNYIELDQYPDHDYYNIPKTAAPNELL